MAQKIDHSGHRERMKKRYRDNMDLGCFAEHEILEILLYYFIPRKNTNFIAHDLIKRFGSLKSVMEASAEELAGVEGVSENCAYSLKFFYSVSKYISKSESVCVDVRDFKIMSEYIRGLFENKKNEQVKVICVDNRFHIQSCSEISSGGVNKVELDLREMTRAILNSGCSLAILAHNHSNGSSRPSEEDIILTRKVMRYLRQIDITLLDHYVCGKDGATSMRSCGLIYDMET